MHVGTCIANTSRPLMLNDARTKVITAQKLDQVISRFRTAGARRLADDADVCIAIPTASRSGSRSTALGESGQCSPVSLLRVRGTIRCPVEMTAEFDGAVGNYSAVTCPLTRSLAGRFQPSVFIESLGPGQPCY